MGNKIGVTMKKNIFCFVFIFLFSLASAAAFWDIFETVSNSSTGLTDTISLANFYRTHVFVPYYTDSGYSQTEYNITKTKTCGNWSMSIGGSCNNTDADLEISFSNMTSAKTCNTTNSNVSGTCIAGTQARGGSNYTLNESANTSVFMNMTINISNSTLSGYNGTFDLNYRAGYFGTNSTGTSSIYIYNSSVWEKIGDLANNGFSDEEYTGLDPHYYASSGLVQLVINHSANSTTGNTGIVVDYISVDYTHRPLLLLNESYQTDKYMNLTINISNDTLGNASSTFRVEVLGGYFGTNATGNTTVSLYNGSAYISQDVNLSLNSYSWINLTDLSGNGTYVNDNVTSILFNHSSNSTTGNTGIIIDTARIWLTANTSITATANITMQGSLDNSHWYSMGTATDVTGVSYNEVNKSAKFIRFNITEMDLGNDTSNNLHISYLGVGRG